jgi:hypothetical protein
MHSPGFPSSRPSRRSVRIEGLEPAGGSPEDIQRYLLAEDEKIGQ